MTDTAQLDAPARDEDGQTLPHWDLTDFYASPDAPEVEADFARAKTMADALVASWRGTLDKRDGDQLATAMQDYQALDELLARLASYASLLYAGDMSDETIAAFQADVNDRVTDLSGQVIFFTLELNALSEERLDALYADSDALQHWRPWLNQLRQWRPHQLDEKLEQLFNDKSTTSRSAWVRLFDETMARMRFTIGDVEVAAADAFNMLSDPDEVTRRAAGVEVGRVLANHAPVLTHITNTLARDKQIEDKWRSHAAPKSSRNLAKHVEDEVVEALVTAVQSAYPRLSHRYYALKAKWFGGDTLDWWNRNAPLPDQDERNYSWEEGVETVLDAYGRFSPKLRDLGAKFFDNPWVDVPPRPGKAPGAFAHPTVPSVHPYLLLNWYGKTRDVMTLAHELGHGVHQLLAGQQGHLMSATPLTLAETASVFGEMLTFRSLLDNESDPKRRKVMLAGKVEDMLNTVIRQIAMHEFETAVHSERAKGELSANRLGEIWMETSRRSLGPALRFDEQSYSHFWSYIPHFIHAPFYVYAYAFGDCLVNALFAVYQDEQTGFADKYFAMLSAGGTLRHDKLLAPFGLDARDPGFWDRGLSVIGGLIDELEALEDG
ncbi:MAG: M3 family oligoendopeptidase [Alphaproteobacteria bacterium]